MEERLMLHKIKKDSKLRTPKFIIEILKKYNKNVNSETTRRII